MTDITKRNAAGMSLEDLREDYRLASLDERNCETNPIQQFQNWFRDAKSAHLKEPNAMTLATATKDGKPSGRIVLLKEFSEIGFVFYTNYDSRKGRELEANPNCALTFLWAELERQVRVEGTVSRIAPEKSEAYFRGRPRGSRLGAWVSSQSEVLPNREVLEKRLAELEEKYAGSDDIPPPDYWGGYCVQPDTIEFWQGRSNRLHDRILYRKTSQTEWQIDRLSP
jgi:pyridoxamine 5'-phosphate oxidase